MSLDNVPVCVGLVDLLVLLGILVLPLLHSGHVKLHLDGLHLIKGDVARDGRSSLADQGFLTVFLGFLVTVFTVVLIVGVHSAFSVFTLSFLYLPS